MKKNRYPVIFLLCMLAGAGQAQTRFGFRAGLQLTDMAYTGRLDPFYYTAILQSKSKPWFNFIAGAIAEREINKYLTINAELHINGRGYNLEPQDSFSDFTTYHAHMWYVQAPLTCNFRWNGFFAGAGPYLGFGLGGKLKSTLYDPVDNTTQRFVYAVKFGNEQAYHFRRPDAGLYAQAGYGWRNVRFILSFQWGLNNIIPDAYRFDNLNARHTAVGVSAAYFLGAHE